MDLLIPGSVPGHVRELLLLGPVILYADGRVVSFRRDTAVIELARIDDEAAQRKKGRRKK